MKTEMINIEGKDYSPILVGFAECCLNCDVKQDHCHMQCHYFEDTEDEYVALKEVKHEESPNIWQRFRNWYLNSKWFGPIESDVLPF